jgi:hypothetical protein
MPSRAHDRDWFSTTAATAWALAFLLMLFGSGIAWIALGVGLCEDDGFPGSDGYCNDGGWEATGLAFIALVAAALVVPAIGRAAGRKRLFWTGIAGPPLVATLVTLLVLKLGTQ